MSTATVRTLTPGQARARAAQCDNALRRIGEHLKEFRQIARRQTQAEAAREIGVSRLTYSRMEQGVSTIKIGYWISAWAYMGQLDKFQSLTHDAHRIAEATAAALLERSKARREAAKND